MANKTKYSGYFSGCLGLLIIGMINTLILFLVIKLFFDIDLTTFLNYLKNVSIVNWLLNMARGVLFLLVCLVFYIVYEIIAFIVKIFTRNDK